MVLEDRIEMPRIYMAWHSPASRLPTATPRWIWQPTCSSVERPRVFTAVSYEKRLALDVSAHQSSREIGSYFLVAATAALGHSLTEAAALIDQELEGFIDQGPTDAEMERAQAQVEAHFVYRLQTVGGWRQVGSAECA